MKEDRIKRRNVITKGKLKFKKTSKTKSVASVLGKMDAKQDEGRFQLGGINRMENKRPKFRFKNSRMLDIQTINAAVREYGMAYSEFMALLKRSGKVYTRSSLAQLARNEPVAFGKVVNELKRVNYRKTVATVKTKITLDSQIYLDTHDVEAAEAYYRALKEVMATIGFERTMENKAILGSWFKRFWLRSKDFVSSKEVQERLEKVERGLELKNIDKVQSEVDLRTAKAIGLLLESSKDIPNFVTRIGSLLFIKVEIDGQSTFFAETLSQKQLKLVEENPALIKKPKELLKKINAIKKSKRMKA